MLLQATTAWAVTINVETTASITGRLGDGLGTFGERLEEVHPKDYDRVAAATFEATKGKTINHLEFRLRRQDGHYVDLLLNAIPLTNEKGEFQELLVVASDVSKLKETENKLKESEEKLASTIASIDDLVFVLDKGGIFNEFHQPSERPGLYVSPEAFIGKSYRDLMPAHVVE